MQLTVRDVSAMLAVPEETVYRWVDREELPGRRVNGEYRFDRAELLEWATIHNRVVLPAMLSPDFALGLSAHAKTPGDLNGAKPMLAPLSAVLSAGGTCSVGGSDKRAVLLDLVNRLQIAGEFDRSVLLDLLVAREEIGSTSVGNGIALPHPKHPVILPVAHAMVTLFYLDPAVKFSSADSAFYRAETEPVHALFVSVSPTLRQHLDLLARLAFVLREESLRSALLRRAPQEEVLDQIRQLELACTAKVVRS